MSKAPAVKAVVALGMAFCARIEQKNHEIAQAEKELLKGGPK